jgi:hypothetical protein
MTFSSRSSRSLCVVLGALTGVAALVVACGSEDESKFGDPANNTQFGNDGGSFNNDSSSPQEDLYKNDPPPSYCGPDAGNPAFPVVTGTEECPDDKNKPGCFCDKPGQTAACWTGLRKNRNLGICKDGQTVCQQKSENTYAWGPCEGQVLPASGATKGAEACKCFSVGQWNIKNLTPCIAQYTPGGGATEYTAVSTVEKAPNTYGCFDYTGPATKPAGDWSTDTLKVDCAGTFKLKYRIRQGNFDAPNAATDCILGEVELPEAYYPTPNVEMPWPNLPSWIGTDGACAKKWDDVSATGVSPGYGEMIVKGESILCDKIDDGAGNDFIFNRIKYCPSTCQANPSTPECMACQTSGSGQF